MFVNVPTRRFMYHLQAILLDLDGYPQKRIDPFVQGFINACRLNGTVEYLAMADATEAALIPFHEARSTTNIDKKAKTTEVKVIKANDDFVKAGLKDLETKINTITLNNQLAVEELNLNVKSLFYSGVEADRVLYFEQLLKAIKLNPLYASVVIQTEVFTKKCIKLYTNKTETDTEITFDVSGKKTLIDPLKDVMYHNFLTTSGFNIDDLSKMSDYFLTGLMEPDSSNPDALSKDQYLVDIKAGMFINDPSIKWNFGDSLKLEGLGLGDARAFLSDTPNPTIIPGRAVFINSGETIETPIQNIGSATEYYLIFASTSIALDAQIKVTVIPKK